MSSFVTALKLCDYLDQVASSEIKCLMKWRLITELVEMLYCFEVIQNLVNDIALTTLF